MKNHLAILRLCIATIYLIPISLSASEPAPPAHEVAPVKQGQFMSSIRVTGKIVPLEGAMFVQAARVSGRLLEILKHEGETVRVGMPLYKISSAECASLSEEERVARDRGLRELLAASEKRRARLDVRLVHEDCIILASASGSLTRRLVELGASFNIGDAVAHIVDTKRLTVELDVPEKDSSHIAVGKNVLVRLASDPEESFASKVTSLIPALDPNTRTTRARLAPIVFKKIPTIEAFVFADIETDAPESSFIVPSTSVVFHQNRRWVLRMKTDSKPEAVAVEVLDDNGDETSVRPLNGYRLDVGDSVMTKGAVFAFKRLRNGGT